MAGIPAGVVNIVTGGNDTSSGLLGVAADGLRQIAPVPQLRGITVAAALGLGGLGLMTVAFPLVSNR